MKSEIHSPGNFLMLKPKVVLPKMDSPQLILETIEVHDKVILGFCFFPFWHRKFYLLKSEAPTMFEELAYKIKYLTLSGLGLSVSV